MLTVNYTDVNGIQSIYEVTDVVYDPNSAACGAGLERDMCVGNARMTFAAPLAAEGKPTLTELSVYSGMVYVMNSEGKTVAKYNLGGWSRKSSGGFAPLAAEGKPTLMYPTTDGSVGNNP